VRRRNQATAKKPAGHEEAEGRTIANRGNRRRNVRRPAEEVEAPLLAVRTADRKIVEMHAGGAGKCYALAADPGETNNLAAAGTPAEFAALDRILQERKKLAAARHAAADSRSDLDPALLRQIRSLGYAR
jgi:hypothetical protein